MKKAILNAIEDSICAVKQLRESADFIERSVREIVEAFQRGNKLLIAGNGGSLCDAMHFAEELTGYFRSKRSALPAIALCESGHITCVANDAGYDYVFARGVEAYGKTGDIFIGLTTSGSSPSIVRAFETAKKLGLSTISFLGKGGGALKGFADHELLIENFKTSDRIQEAHMVVIHIMIEQIESLLFNNPQ